MPNYTNGIYNPLDIWHRPYFTITTDGVFRNTNCALAEKDYESLCETYSVNPIYPPESLAFSEEFQESLPEVIPLKLPRKKQEPRESLAEKIARKRHELGHNL